VLCLYYYHILSCRPACIQSHSFPQVRIVKNHELADNILSELKGLKNIPEGDHMKFISMVETVETCWLDLKRMKLESEMNTATMISQIEK
jgi:hypothetical protein